MCYGNDSYGGMSGRDLMVAAVDLYEVTNEPYLASLIGQVQCFAQKLVQEKRPSPAAARRPRHLLGDEQLL
jgi:tryptophanase